MGTTAEKLTYLNDTKLAIKNELNKLGAEIQDNDTFRSYVNKLKAIYNDYPTVSDTGSSISLNNTKKAPFKEILLNSTELTQDGTPSPSSPVDVNVIKGENNVKVENKNLATSNWGENFVSRINDSSLASITTQDNRDCVKYTANAGYGDYDNKYLFKTNWKENTQYTISYFAYSSTGYLNLSIEYTDGTNTSMDGTLITNWSKITLTSTANKTIKYIRGRYTGGITYIDLDTFQVEEGIIATEYVEHQEQNYPISLSSKNLLNIINFVGSRNNLDIKIENQQITINGTATSGTYTWLIITKDNFYTRNGTPSASAIVDYANGKIISTGIVTRQKYYISGTSTLDFGISLYGEDGSQVSTPIETTKIIAVAIYLGNGQTFNNYKFGIQLEVGSTATEYEPYHEPIEYCKTGDYADQIFKNTTDSEFYDSALELNEWYLKKNVNKTIITDDNKNLFTTFGEAYGHLRVSILKSSINCIQNYETNVVKVNKYKEVASTSSVNTGCFTNNFGKYSMLFFNDTFESLEDAQNKMVGTIIYNPLATPQYIHISQEEYPTLKAQLDNLYNNSKSYNEQTNITQTNDDLPFNLSVEILEKINI